MRTIRIVGALAAAFLAAACVPRPPAPAPAPAPPPRPAPPPPESPPPPPPASWEDAPLSPGDWSYRDNAGTSAASYVAPGVGTVAVTCVGGGEIVISVRPVAAPRPGSIIVRTTYGERRLAARPDNGRVDGVLAVGDPLLDQIVFSRGRFLVQAEGGPAVIAPSWPEPARVVEDCRA